MDARVRTGPPGGATAYDQPAGAPAGSSPGAGAGAAGAGAAGGPAGGTAYSASFGDAGMSDFRSESAGATGANGSGHHPADALRDVGAKFAELKEFASYYVAAKLDSYKITARNLGIYAALGVIGLIAGSAIITTAAVLLLVGLALAIGKPFDPDQPWVGALVVGLLVLGGLVGGIILFMKKLTNTSRKRVVEKYENRQRDQRIYYGEDVRGRRAGSGV